jgi:plasmid stabilization system protein ParE
MGVPQRYRIVMAPSASRDLDRIFKYVFAISPAGARSLKNSIVDQIASLMIFPHRTVAVERVSLPEVRSLPVENYVIYFSVLEDSSTVQILRIHHGARKPPRSFS